MKPINEQISPKFVIQARKLAKYTKLIRDILPAECHSHVQVANIRNQNLMLITDSPVWTTRLRQLSPQILQYIREHSLSTDKDANSKDAGDQNKNIGNFVSPAIHHVQISTRYQASTADNPTSPQIKNRPKPKISEKSAELLSRSANSIEHQQLKTALFKLSRINKQNKGEK